MTGTSLDGIDGVLTSFKNYRNTIQLPFPKKLRNELISLQSKGFDEIHRSAIVSNEIAYLYSDCVSKLLKNENINPSEVKAIGAHGQTIRHQPQFGYTKQIINSALLAELSGIDVISDFRSRDIAAGGQGAPLVPAFHNEFFSTQDQTTLILNIGGISNITILRPKSKIIGFDTGPGNILMDEWIYKNKNQTFDDQGNWARSGSVIPELLNLMLGESYLSTSPPKSTGRELFNSIWLEKKISKFKESQPQNIQATLSKFTAISISDAIKLYAPDAKKLYVCGGGAFNSFLIQEIDSLLNISLSTTEDFGISPKFVESVAFAWLASIFCKRLKGSITSVTGAKGPRILGSLHPA